MSWGVRSFFRLSLQGLAVLCLVLLFQNCLQMNKGFKTTSASGMQGNGHGYDGRLYVHISASACADGKPYDSAIETRGGLYYLTRDNCLDIPLADQIAVTASVHPDNPAQLYYNGRLYIEHVDIVGPLLAEGASLYSTISIFPIENQKLQYMGKFAGKFDRRGRPLWVKQFMVNDSTTVTDATAQAVMPDGGSVLAVAYIPNYLANTANYSYQNWITRMDAAGNRVWIKSLSAGVTNYAFRKMSTDASGNIYVLGTLRQPASGGLPANPTVFTKLGPNGDLLYSRVLDRPFGLSNNMGVVISPAGEPFIFGMGNAPDYSHWIVKLDASGGTAWSRTYAEWRSLGLSFADDGALMARASFNTTIAGSPLTQARPLYAEFNTDGTVKAQWRITNATWERRTFGLLQKSGNGEFFAAMELDTGKVAVIRFNRDMTTEWAQNVELVDKKFSYMEMVGPDYFAHLLQPSSLPGYEHSIVDDWKVPGLMNGCSGCTPITVSFAVTADPVTLAPGPVVSSDSAVQVGNAAVAPFADAHIYLPMK